LKRISIKKNQIHFQKNINTGIYQNTLPNPFTSTGSVTGQKKLFAPATELVEVTVPAIIKNKQLKSPPSH
jgi:hypothetical protein